MQEVIGSIPLSSTEKEAWLILVIDQAFFVGSQAESALAPGLYGSKWHECSNASVAQIEPQPHYYSHNDWSDEEFVLYSQMCEYCSAEIARKQNRPQNGGLWNHIEDYANQFGNSNPEKQMGGDAHLIRGIHRLRRRN
jgi:hypothetical protein